jgi:hypothetical protein
MSGQSPKIEAIYGTQVNYLVADYETKEKPLWYHNAGLMQTASGYGKKLVSSKMLRIQGEKVWRRIYVVCFSSSGSSYILVHGKPVYLRG